MEIRWYKDKEKSYFIVTEVGPQFGVRPIYREGGLVQRKSSFSLDLYLRLKESLLVIK